MGSATKDLAGNAFCSASFITMVIYMLLELPIECLRAALTSDSDASDAEVIRSVGQLLGQ